MSHTKSKKAKKNTSQEVILEIKTEVPVVAVPASKKRGRPKKDQATTDGQMRAAATGHINKFASKSATKAAGTFSPDPNFRYRVTKKQVAANIEGDSQIINGIKIEMYIPLVKWLAGRVSAHLPSHVDREDLISEGFCGLLQAASKYNSSKGRFETFARNRICGSMVDWLRSIDRFPRSAREAIRKIEAAENAAFQDLQRPPTTAETAAKMNISVDDLVKRKFRLNMPNEGATAGATQGFSQNYHTDNIASSLHGDHSIDRTEPLEQHQIHDMIVDLAEAIGSLGTVDKTICLLAILEGIEVGQMVAMLQTGPSQIRASKQHLSQISRHQIF